MKRVMMCIVVLCLALAACSAFGATVEFCTNQGFEIGTGTAAPPWYGNQWGGTGYAVDATAEDPAHTGSRMWHLFGDAAPGSPNSVEEAMSLSPGGSYHFSCYMRAPLASPTNPVTVYFNIWFGNAGSLYVSRNDSPNMTLTSPDWTLVEYGADGAGIPCPGNCDRVLFRIRTNASTFVDDASVLGELHTVSGTVLKAETEGGPTTPAQGATVTIMLNDGVVATQTADSNGAYSFDVGPGAYTLAATMFNYGTDMTSVDVVDGDVTANNLTLTKYGTSILTGKVFKTVGTSQVPVAGVTVTASLGASGSVSSTPSDTNGNYSLEVTTGQQYALTASHPSGLVLIVGPLTVLPDVYGEFPLDIEVQQLEPATATLLDADTATKGMWIGKYGSQGYAIATTKAYDSCLKSTSMPYEMAVTGQDDWFNWGGSGLQNPADNGATFLPRSGWGKHVGVFNIDLNPTDQAAHQVAFFCQDGDAHNRRQTVELYDVLTNTLLSSYAITTDMNQGIWLVWKVTGHVNAKITHVSGDGWCSSVMGVFFDTPPAQTWTIGASAGAGGSISPSGNIIVANGGSRTFAITPAYGYVIADVVVDGQPQGAITSYTFSGVTDNHTISATFTALPTFTVTATAGANGSISPSGTLTLPQGANQTFTITPNTGYAIVAVTVDGQSKGKISTYTFSNIVTNHTIDVTFVALNAYTITSTAGPNGSISPLGAQTVYEGSSKTFTITPDSGFAVDTLKVDNNVVSPVASYTFSNVVANHTIDVTFKTATPASAQLKQVDSATKGMWIGKYGSQGYAIATTKAYSTCLKSSPLPPAVITVTGQDDWFNWGGSGLQNPADNGATFLPKSGWAKHAGSFYIDLNMTDGATHEVSLYCQDGDATNRRQNIEVYDTSPTPVLLASYYINYPMNQGVWVTFKVAGHVKVKVIHTNGEGWCSSVLGVFFDPDRAIHTITASTADSGGTISPSGVTSVVDGTNATFAITPSSGYRVKNVLVDNVSVGTPTSYTFSSVTADHTIVASFEAMIPAVVEFLGEDTTTQGSWIGNYGSDGYCIASAKQVANCAKSLPSYAQVGLTNQDWFPWEGTYALTNPTNTSAKIGAGWCQQNNWFSIDLNVQGTDPHIVSIYCYDADSVNRRQLVEVIDAATGSVLHSYNIDTPMNTGRWLSWKITNSVKIKVTHPGPGSMTSPPGWCSAVQGVFFDSLTHQVTATAGSNGSISPSGTRTVTRGTSQSFTITANPGYEVSDVVVNGVSKGALTSLVIDKVMGNYTITASFAPEAAPVASLAELKTHVGESVVLNENVTAVSKGIDLFFVGEEQYKGTIMVKLNGHTMPTGSFVTNLKGVVTKDAYDQYTLTLSADPTSTETGNVIKPIGMNNKAARTDAKALTNLVRIWGNAAGDKIDDGYGNGGITVVGGTLGTNVVAVDGVLWQENGAVVLYQNVQ